MQNTKPAVQTEESEVIPIKLAYLVTGESSAVWEAIDAFEQRARWMDRVRPRYGEVTCESQWSAEMGGYIVTVTSLAPKRPGASTEGGIRLMVSSALMNESRSRSGVNITLLD